MPGVKKSVLRQLTEISLLFLIGGLVNGYLSCRSCFSEMGYAIPIICYCGCMWVLLWKGNELISVKTDQQISWVREPKKRFIIGVILFLVYTVSSVIITSFIFIEFVFKLDFNKSFRVEVIPTMLYSIVVAAFIMLIIFSRHFLQAWRQTAINEEKLRRENIASRYEALKNQVNPHFLFNTLNALSSLIYEDQEKAVQFINKFSDVYRYVLDSRDKEVVPVREEINFVNSYIYLLLARYEKNLNVDIDQNLNDGFIPPMSIQLLVENAVKHNIIADESPLHIGIKKDGSNILIENNIHLKNPGDNKSGLGINNIISRYSILSDSPVIINNDGSTFRVSIPILDLEK